MYRLGVHILCSYSALCLVESLRLLTEARGSLPVVSVFLYVIQNIPHCRALALKSIVTMEIKLRGKKKKECTTSNVTV